MNLPAASRSELRLLSGLRRRGPREEQGLLLVEGRTLLDEALGAGLHPRLVAVTQAAAVDAAASLAAAAAHGARIVMLAERHLDYVTDTRGPTGLVSAVPAPAPWTAALHPGVAVLVPVLWGLADPGNVGTLLRSAWAFGAVGCLLGPGSADPGGPKVLRASAGAGFHLPCLALHDLAELVTLADRNQAELRVARAHAAPAAAPACVLPARCLLVLGHETRGPPPELVAPVVSVPQRAKVESLNVGVAGSILMAAWYAEHAA